MRAVVPLDESIDPRLRLLFDTMDIYQSVATDFLKFTGAGKGTFACGEEMLSYLVSMARNKIKAKAPADYLASPDIFSSGPREGLLLPHFLDGQAADTMREAKEGLAPDEAKELYDRFCDHREAAITLWFGTAAEARGT